MNITRGMSRMLLAIGLFSVMGAFIKAAIRIPAGEAVFFRSVFALPILLVWLATRHDLKAGLRTRNIKDHFFRSIFGTLAMGLSFAGLKYLPLPEVTALRFVTPVLIVVFAAILLRERFRFVRMFAVALGLVGVLIILWPRLMSGAAHNTTETIGAAMILASASFAALAQISIKRMAGVEQTAAIVFYFSVTSMAISLLSVPFGWVWPTTPEWVFLVGAGVLGGSGQILLTSSYRFADAGVLAPFTYSAMLWSLLIGYFVFNEAPTVMMLAGATLVIFSGVVIAWREHQLKNGEREVL